MIVNNIFFYFIDGILKKEYNGDRLTQFRQLDDDTKKKFDAQNSRFKKIESAYSIQVCNICTTLTADIIIFTLFI